jgi:hypothetical protein
MLFHWYTETFIWFGTFSSVRSRSPFLLVVEKLATHASWDWVVWRRGEPPGAARCGMAISAKDAAREAEATAVEMARSGRTRLVERTNPSYS